MLQSALQRCTLPTLLSYGYENVVVCAFRVSGTVNLWRPLGRAVMHKNGLTLKVICGNHSD